QDSGSDEWTAHGPYGQRRRVSPRAGGIDFCISIGRASRVLRTALTPGSVQLKTCAGAGPAELLETREDNKKNVLLLIALVKLFTKK
ncbi:unnamed protein product, partial [Amoebophrya sp. A120]